MKKNLFLHSNIIILISIIIVSYSCQKSATDNILTPTLQLSELKIDKLGDLFVTSCDDFQQIFTQKNEKNEQRALINIKNSMAEHFFSYALIERGEPTRTNNKLVQFIISDRPLTEEINLFAVPTNTSGYFILADLPKSTSVRLIAKLKNGFYHSSFILNDMKLPETDSTEININWCLVYADISTGKILQQQSLFKKSYPISQWHSSIKENSIISPSTGSTSTVSSPAILGTQTQTQVINQEIQTSWEEDYSSSMGYIKTTYYYRAQITRDESTGEILGVVIDPVTAQPMNAMYQDRYSRWVTRKLTLYGQYNYYTYLTVTSISVFWYCDVIGIYTISPSSPFTRQWSVSKTGIF